MTKEKQKSMVKITFDKKSAWFIFDIVKGMFPKKCIYCGKKITAKNIGCVIREGFVCENICCLFQLLDKHKEL
jgi:hypothetical protein